MLCPVFACGVRMSVAGPSPTPRPLPAPPVLRLELHSRRSWPSALASLFAHAALIAGVLVQGRAALRRGAVPGGGGGGGAGGGRPVINFFPMPARAAPAAVDVPPAPRVSVTALPALQQIRLDLPRVEGPPPHPMAGPRGGAPAGGGGGQGAGTGGGGGGG